ncbi:MAG: HNH endonuclease [Cyclobacteriaceae bacterium]
MRNCVICRKDKEEFNTEHIIPDSIGGTLIIDSVCTECNSKLGSKVDKHLVNHFFFVAKRESLQLKSQNNLIPNSFDTQTFFLKSDTKQHLRFEKDLNRFKLIPKVKKNGVSFDINDTKNIKKYCKKHKLNISQFDIFNVSNQLIGEIKIDTININIALLKIAYEFAIKELPYYYEDKNAKIISSKIYDVAYGSANPNVIDTSGVWLHSTLLESNKFDLFRKYIDLDSNNHLMILYSHKNLGLFCDIKIFDVIYFSVQLSENMFDIDIMVFENELENRDNKVESLIEFIFRKTVNP